MRYFVREHSYPEVNPPQFYRQEAAGEIAELWDRDLGFWRQAFSTPIEYKDAPYAVVYYIELTKDDLPAFIDVNG